MGYYINENSKGEPLAPHNKVIQLIDDGAIIINPPSWQENLICVVENGVWDAAGFCYSKGEYNEFLEINGRRKTFLVHPLAKKLSGYEKEQ